MEINIDWKKIKKIFFVGIKGVGMTPLAIIAKQAGFEVAGSDLSEEFITDEVLIENNLKIYTDFDPDVISEFFKGISLESCLIITTGAHSGYNNPQVLRGKELRINYINQGRALSIFMTGLPFGRELTGITVTGSHGKTTISAIIASCFVKLGYDPSYAVGTSRIVSIGPAGHLGKGSLFIAEGDEYVGEPVYDKTPKILYQHPTYAIINNIDFDHPDIYSGIEDVVEVMRDFINGIEDGGKLFINADDKNLIDIKSSIKKSVEVFTYGEGDCDYKIYDIEEKVGSVKFKVSKKGEDFGNFCLSIPGRHNCKNALAVIALLDSFGIDCGKIRSSILEYKGCKRRMEMIGKTLRGAGIIDDYGHHPVEIKSTLEALKNFYGKKIVCVFQSHTYSRTKKLLNEFSESFSDVDELILVPIFKSQRDTELDIITDEEFAKPFKEKKEKMYMSKSIEDAFEFINSKSFNEDYIIVTMGAGDVYKVGYKLKI